MKAKPSLVEICALSAGLFVTCHCHPALAQVLFLDNFEQFANGTDLTSTSYTPASGPPTASVVTSVQNGSPTITAVSSPSSSVALFDNSVVSNKNTYKAILSSVQSNQVLQITWRMWIEATNHGAGGLLFSVPVKDANPGVTFNPPLAFMDTGMIVALTNGTTPLIPIGNWGSLAGAILTNSLVLDYHHHTFSYSLNGQTLATLPLGPYFTNVVGAIYFNGVERDGGSLGNRFAIDDVKVEAIILPEPSLAPSWRWAKRIASTINEDGELSIGLALDAAANVYVSGWFDGTNDFGGGVWLTNSPGGGQDIFVAKYNSDGTFQWARRAGSATPPGAGTHDQGRDAGRGIGVDDAGNVYVTGGFFGDADFGPFNVSAPTNKEFFLAKYDRFGTVQWVRQSIGGNGTSGPGWDDGAYGTGLAVDKAGNSYAVGFAANVTAGRAPVMFGTTSLFNTNVDGASSFLVKYDSAGVVQWAQLMGGPGETYATKVALDSLGNVYVRGSFSQSMTIGSSNLVSSSATDADMFLAKFDNSGALIWVRRSTGANVDEGGVAADQQGSVYVSGWYGTNAVNFDGVVLTNAGFYDAFIAKYNSEGVIQWAHRAGSSSLDYDFYWDAALDSHGNPYVTGILSFNSDPASGSGGATVAKYDASGTFQWASSAIGTIANPASSLGAKCAVDLAGNCYVAGWYLTPTSFGTNVLQPQGYWNFFLAKLGSAPLTAGPPPLNGSDDFNDNFTDPTRWGPDVLISGCGGLLTETNGRLEFTKSSGCSSALVVRPWILNSGSYTQDWEVQIDVSVPDLGFPEATFGLAVTSGISTDFSNTNSDSNNRFSMALFASDSPSRIFLMRFGVKGGTFDRTVELDTTSTFAGLRLAFDASTKVLSAFYDEDGPVGGYSWSLLGSTNISTAWSMTATSVFGVFVSGRTEADVVVSSDNLFGDNFFASTQSPPRLGITLAGGNVVLNWSTNASGFQLQSASAFTPPVGWPEVTNAPVIVGSNFVVTNALSDGTRFYRLSR